MRKDGKNSYQAKKEKLLEIKKLLLELQDEINNQAIKKLKQYKPTEENWVLTLREIENTFYFNKIGKLWSIVKDEK